MTDSPQGLLLLWLPLQETGKNVPSISMMPSSLTPSDTEHRVSRILCRQHLLQRQSQNKNPEETRLPLEDLLFGGSESFAPQHTRNHCSRLRHNLL